MKEKLSQKFLAVGVLGGIAALLVMTSRSPRAPEDEGRASHTDEIEVATDFDLAPARVVANDENPRNLLNRPWFDKLPKGRKDTTDLWLFFGGGIGIEDRGSYFRSTLDIFELERQKDKLDIVFLHDQKKVSTSFTVKKCDEQAPFDLCLVLTNGIRDVKKLYSWADDDDMDQHVPWARAWRRASAERARKAVER